MRKSLLLLMLLPACCLAQVDKVKTAEIEKEGKALYHSEMASWYGTDLFLEKFKEKQAQAGGYFSYREKDSSHCIFFTGEEQPSVLVRISFDSSYNLQRARVDETRRSFNPKEQSLYTIREKALQIINTDTIFKVYNNTSLNLVPLVNGAEKKVYVLTAPKVGGVAVFGNDYLLSFNDKNELVEKKRLHKNIIPIGYGESEKAAAEGGITMHSHLPETGDYITATDICTLMLYAKFAKWKQHYVMSKNFVSIWTCDKNELLVLTMEAWDEINQHQAEKKKD